MIGRLATALAIIAAFEAPLAAQARDCATIRALTNVDGRNFADLVIRLRPFSIFIGAGRGDSLPAPTNCDLESEDGPFVSDDAIQTGSPPILREVGLTCRWSSGDSAFYGAMLERMQRCLDGRLTLPAGPIPYGSSWTRLQHARTELSVPGGTSEVELSLIETDNVPARQYVELSVLYRPSDE